jgi:hypothetical protein
MEAEVIPSSSTRANPPLTPILEDMTVGISNANTLGHVLYDIMGWDLEPWYLLQYPIIAD